MGRGGARPGAGGKPTWNYGKTKTIRVPEFLSAQILEYARKLDAGLVMEADVVNSKIIDLSSLNIPQIRDKKFIFLQDLVRLGYEIQPSSLAIQVKKEILQKR